jgi:hypothetical protein
VHIGNAMGAGGGVASRASVRGRDVLIEVAGGILGRDVSLRRVTVTPDPTDYLAVEISATRDLRLVDSDVTAIASGTEPVLVRSTCETSEIYGTSATWGVCSND